LRDRHQRRVVHGRRGRARLRRRPRGLRDGPPGRALRRGPHPAAAGRAAGSPVAVTAEGRATDDGPVFRVRPYALTGGRTRSTLDLPLETLVLVSPRGRAVMDQLGVEQRQIMALAEQPISLAELAAHLDVVIGAV